MIPKFYILLVVVLGVTQVSTCHAGYITTSSGKFYLNGNPFEPRGVNYVSNKNLNGYIFDQVPLNVMQSEIADIAGLGLNTIRIFMRSDEIDDGIPRYQDIARLGDIISICDSYNIHLIVTLGTKTIYPDNPNYVSVLNKHKREISAIITPFITSKAILAWDLGNEADSVWQNPEWGHTLQGVKTYYNYIADHVRSIDPNHLITVGDSGGGSGAIYNNNGNISINLEEFSVNLSKIDFHCIHPYADPWVFSKIITELSSVTSLPILIEELGKPDNGANINYSQSHFSVLPWDEYAVTDTYAKWIGIYNKAYLENRVAGIMFWTYMDYPPGVVGGQDACWQDSYGVTHYNSEHYFGLFDVNRLIKPQGVLIRDKFRQTTVAPMSSVPDFLLVDYAGTLIGIQGLTLGSNVPKVSLYGDIGYQFGWSYSANSGIDKSLGTFDIDGNGYDDPVIINNAGNISCILVGPTGLIGTRVLGNVREVIGWGFTSQQNWDLPLGVGDYNNDKKLDIYIINGDGYVNIIPTDNHSIISVPVCTGNIGTFFRWGMTSQQNWDKPLGLADFNGDLIDDILIINGDGHIHALLLSSQGRFSGLKYLGQVSHFYPGMAFSSQNGWDMPVALEDVDHNGSPDIVIVNGDGYINALLCSTSGLTGHCSYLGNLCDAYQWSFSSGSKFNLPCSVPFGWWW